MSAGPSPPYSGRILDQDDSFRLLELQAGREDEPITVKLIDAQLSQAPRYEALSYVWGDASNVTAIQVEHVDEVPDSTSGQSLLLFLLNNVLVLHFGTSGCNIDLISGAFALMAVKFHRHQYPMKYCPSLTALYSEGKRTTGSTRSFADRNACHCQLLCRSQKA